MKRDKRKMRERMKKAVAWVLTLAVIGNLAMGDLLIVGAEDPTDPTDPAPVVTAAAVTKPGLVDELLSGHIYPGNDYDFSCEVTDPGADDEIIWSLSDESLEGISVERDADDQTKAVLHIGENAAGSSFKVVAAVGDSRAESDEITVGSMGELTINDITVSNGEQALTIEDVDGAYWINKENAFVKLANASLYDQYKNLETGNWEEIPETGIEISGTGQSIQFRKSTTTQISSAVVLNCDGKEPTLVITEILSPTSGYTDDDTVIWSSQQEYVVNASDLNADGSQGAGIEQIYYYNAEITEEAGIDADKQAIEGNTVVFTDNTRKKIAFFAVDKLGNKSAVSDTYSINIDTGAPVITVDKDDTWNVQEQKFYINKENLGNDGKKYTVSVTDADTGIQSFQWKLGVNSAEYHDVDVTEGTIPSKKGNVVSGSIIVNPTDAGKSEELSYELTALDNVGKEAKNSELQVVYDPNPPTVNAELPSVITDNNGWINSEIAKETSLPITVSYSDDMSGAVKVEYRIVKGTEVIKEFSEVNITGTNPIVNLADDMALLSEQGEVYTYEFRATDKAGNTTADENMCRLDIKLDVTVPTPDMSNLEMKNSVSVKPENGDAIPYFNNDNKKNKSASVTIPLSDSASGIQSVTAKRVNPENPDEPEIENIVVNQDSVNIPIEYIAEGEQTYTFTVTDIAGNTTTEKFGVNWDTEAPDNFEVCVWDEDPEEATSTWQSIWKKGSEIQEQITEFITGKKSVWIDVYAEDSGTGVEEIQCEYKTQDGTETVQSTDLVSGIGESGETKYHFRVKVEISKDIDAEVISVTATDKAGNVRKQSPSESTEAPRFIVDTEAPKLSVKVQNPSNIKDGIAYYNENQLDDQGKLSLTLTLTEEHFLRDGEKKYGKENYYKDAIEEVEIKKIKFDKKNFKFDDENSEETVTDIEWTRDENSQNSYSKEFKFEPGYKYSISYKMKDGAGNILVADSVDAGTVSSEGEYTYTLAIDTESPSCDNKLAITQPAQQEESNGSKVYYNNDKLELIASGIKENMFFKEDPVLTMKYTNTKESSAPEQTDNKMDWENAGSDSYTGRYHFTEEGEYEFSLGYTDRAGHKMEDVIFENDKGNTIVVLDRTSPVISYEYKSSGKTTVVGQKDEAISFCDSDRTLTITVDEVNFNPARIDVDVTAADAPYEKTITEDTPEKIKEYFHTAAMWKTLGNKHTCSYTFKEEGRYAVKVSGKDEANNPAEVIDAGTFVVDKTNPVIESIEISSQDNQDEEFRTVGNRTYFDKDTKTVNVDISVKEHNFYNKNLANTIASVVVEAKDITGKDVQITEQLEKALQNKNNWTQVIDKNGKATDTYEFKYQFTTEANYTISNLQITDMAERRSNVWKTEEFTIDHTNPEIKYEVESSRSILNYLTFGYFGSKNVIVKATVTDKISGVYGFNFATDPKAASSSVSKTKSGQPKETDVFALRLDADFKGYVSGTAEDYSKNTDTTDLNGSTAPGVKKLGIIVEKEDTHNDNSSIKFTYPEANKNGFYNHSIDVQIAMEDSYSGLNNVKYGAKTSEAGDNAEPEFSGEKDVRYAYEDTVKLDADKYYSNDITVYAELEDNAGRKLSDSRTLKIDNRAPVITVTYDNNNPLNGKYFNRNRTATVTINERNFDPSRTELVWTSTGAAPSISGWTSEGETHTAYVTFSADADYTFTVKATDLADNTASYSRVDEFTVDQTTPGIQVTYDNNNAREGNYYNAPRTATIQITEHNFNAGEVQITGTATENGAGVSFPATNGWSSSGDVHTATIYYSDDAHYTFDIAYTDLAGNAAAAYPQDQFVVDKTNPTLTIRGVRDESANNQETIGFVLTGSDNNFGTMSPKLTALVKDEKGSFSTVDVPMTNEQSNGNDHIYTVANLDADGIYTLSCSVTDRAGNSCDKVSLQDADGNQYGEKTYSGENDTLLEFSVNRLGSTYRINLKPKNLNEVGITNEKAENIEVQIEEINVDDLKEEQTRLDLYNGLKAEKVALKKGKNYQTGFAQGTGGWRKYTYTLDGSNFEDDGNYQVGVYSVDKAGNESDSSLKNNAKAKIAFIVDRTSPVISMNVETRDSYNQVEKVVELNVTELHLDKKGVEVTVNGEKLTMDKEIQDKGNGQFEFVLGSGMNQDISVKCTDQAGNASEISAARLTVSTNVFVRAGAWMLNHLLVCVFILILLILLILAIIMWYMKEKNKKRIEIEEE